MNVHLYRQGQEYSAAHRSLEYLNPLSAYPQNGQTHSNNSCENVRIKVGPRIITISNKVKDYYQTFQNEEIYALH